MITRLLYFGVSIASLKGSYWGRTANADYVVFVDEDIIDYAKTFDEAIEIGKKFVAEVFGERGIKILEGGKNNE